MKRPVLLCVVAALALGGCGVGVQDEPTPIDTRGAAANQPAAPRGSASVLWFVRDDRLTPVLRRTSSDERSRLDALLDGVTPEEAARGVRDALPASIELRDVRRTGPLLTVDVHGDLGEATAAEQTIAVAQIVFTATEPASGVSPPTVVQLLVDGVAVEVPRADGSLTGRDLARADFPSIIEPTTPTTSATGQTDTSKPTLTPTPAPVSVAASPPP